MSPIYKSGPPTGQIRLISEHLSAREIIDLVADDGSFIPWELPPEKLAAVQQVPITQAWNASYEKELHATREKTGLDEAIIIGESRLFGRRVAVIASEFNFLAGSVGVETAERVVYAIERATAERLPLISTPTSGGTRMQEGVIAFLQMIKISTAVTLHKNAGLPYVCYLRDPTFGGVLASWASLAHVCAAEPNARIGFLGPRVFEMLNGHPFPKDIQTAENLFEHGIIDGVVESKHLSWLANRALTVLCGDVNLDARVSSAEIITEVPATFDSWKSVEISRNPQRPGALDIIRTYMTEFVPLSGTGEGESSSALLIALGRFGGYPAVVLGQARFDKELGPGALREARRGFRLAQELHLPLVMMIDTWGAALSPEAEQGGLAGEIARCLADLSVCNTATCSVIIGQGTGGGALALLPADIVLCAENAWLAPLPPEGSSTVIYRDVEHAREMAIAQKISSAELLAQGIVDGIIPEPQDPALEPEVFIRRVGDAIAFTLAQFHGQPQYARQTRRHVKYRNLGL